MESEGDFGRIIDDHPEPTFPGELGDALVSLESHEGLVRHLREIDAPALDVEFFEGMAQSSRNYTSMLLSRYNRANSS